MTHPAGEERRRSLTDATPFPRRVVAEGSATHRLTLHEVGTWASTAPPSSPFTERADGSPLRFGPRIDVAEREHRCAGLRPGAVAGRIRVERWTSSTRSQPSPVPRPSVAPSLEPSSATRTSKRSRASVCAASASTSSASPEPPFRTGTMTLASSSMSTADDSAAGRAASSRELAT